MDALREEPGEREHLSAYALVAGPDTIYLATIYLAEPERAVDLIRGGNVAIHQLVDVLAPFSQDGRHIPDLLKRRDHLAVDSAVRGGEPVIEGTRIPAAEVAALVRDGVPPDRVSDFYPGVSAAAARDAADVSDYVDSYVDSSRQVAA
ncbi:DUF433 domain-containing protein [Streptomyces sp. PT12]|uniref:DUF433 domain-containing protein n=1 Tax=Streptomyces sp. PT12 TaxID=1510197 RepID=UPI00215D0D82|nr:DUF433 domain-containing protein [Streptomyces sp. PT12]